MLKLALLSLGVVFGDIGTSPLYAVRESFAHHSLELSEANILGVLSLITWSLLIVISLKYLFVVMNAAMEGEGGILILTALVNRHKKTRWGLVCGLFGTALLYGDGVLTPAISVLSAVEGLKVATDFFVPYVLPITAGILLVLFFFQKTGTANVGRFFGPVVACWFVCLGLLGVAKIVQNPSVLRALSPTYGVEFFLRNGFAGVLVLGSIFLVVTGGEALYADMGHFGRRPIQIAWFGLVLPGLLLNYFGQGALLLDSPGALDNPFYRMAPDWALYPLVVLATAATVIASQALISGAFSLTAQAVDMGYLPKVKVVHTSKKRVGQVYVPTVNWLLALGCVGVVYGFRTSSALAAAYGVAVAVTMVITTILLYLLARTSWGWSRWRAGAVCGFFLIVDLGYAAGNIGKIPEGGWFPLTVALLVYTLMSTWRSGNWKLQKSESELADDWESFQSKFKLEGVRRIPGTAVYLTSKPGLVPVSLASSLRYFDALHEHVVILTVQTTELPFLRGRKRLEISQTPLGFKQVILHFGYLELQDVPGHLKRAHDRLGFEVADCIYVVSSTEMEHDGSPWKRWRLELFRFLDQNQTPVGRVFHLPSDRMVELGLTLKIE